MSTDADRPDDAVRQRVTEAFAPRLTSEQAKDTDSSLDGGRERHHDGADMRRVFDMPPVYRWFQKAGNRGNSLAEFPQAFPRMIAQLTEFELNAIEAGVITPDGDDAPGWFHELPIERSRLLLWYAGFDNLDDPAPERAVIKRRTDRLPPSEGGFELLIHGAQGKGKSAFLRWLEAILLQTKPSMDVFCLSTLDDTEWTALAPWTTLCLPQDVEIRVTGMSSLRPQSTPTQLEPADVSRDVIRYGSPDDLLSTIAERRPGQHYVVYPDPHFRGCESITGWPYVSVWEAESATEATKLRQFWFALQERVVDADFYNRFATITCDEAHKQIPEGARSDNHEHDKKIDDLKNTIGDARKQGVSFVFATHNWKEVSHKIRKWKIRWGLTMPDEQFPDIEWCPLDGSFSGQWRGDDIGIGDVCVWDKDGYYNDFGFPYLGGKFNPQATIKVGYPGMEAAR